MNKALNVLLGSALLLSAMTTAASAAAEKARSADIKQAAKELPTREITLQPFQLYYFFAASVKVIESTTNINLSPESPRTGLSRYSIQAFAPGDGIVETYVNGIPASRIIVHIRS